MRMGKRAYEIGPKEEIELRWMRMGQGGKGPMELGLGKRRKSLIGVETDEGTEVSRDI